MANIFGHIKTSPETRLLNKLKGETMLIAKLILTPESPVEGTEGKRQQQVYPNLGYDLNHQMVIIRPLKGSRFKPT